jgi:hypothetical protein
MKKIILLSLSHATAALLGFGLGIYLLPILIAPDPPTTARVREQADDARFAGRFRRDLEDSDALHWGEGAVTISRNAIALEGRLAPGPDYRLYLSPEFIETETDFNRLKPSMTEVGRISTFQNFVVPLPPTIDPAEYSAVIVWCESFGQFITAAEYRPVDNRP